MARPLVLIIVQLLLCAPVRGQSILPSRETKPSGAASFFTGRQFDGDLEFSTIYDTNLLRNPADEALATYGAVTSLSLGFEDNPDQPRFFLNAGGALYRYAATDERDQWNFRLRAAYRWYLSDAWSTELISLVSLGVITPEYLFADQANLLGRLEFDPDYNHRARLYVAYRHRLYRDNEGTTAFSPYAIGTYRYRWGSWHYLDNRVGYEENRAELEHRRYRRLRIESTYTRPLTKRDRLRAGVEYQTQPFDDFRLEDGALRQDRTIIADLYWIRDLLTSLRLYTNYEYRLRRSNAPERDYVAHRFTVTLRYDF